MSKTTVTKKIRRGIGQTRTFTREEIRQIQTRPARVFDLSFVSEKHKVANAQVELKRLHRLARSVGSEHDGASFDELARLPDAERAKVFKKNAAKRLRRYQRRTSALLAIVLPMTRAADLAAAARGEAQ